MKKVFLAIATVATVLATIVPAYAAQQIDCTVTTRANFALCVIQNSRNGSHDG